MKKVPKIHETDHVLPGGSPVAVTGEVDIDTLKVDGSSLGVVSGVEFLVADLPRDKRLLGMRKLADRTVKEYNRFVEEKGGKGRIVLLVVQDELEVPGVEAETEEPPLPPEDPEKIREAGLQGSAAGTALRERLHEDLDNGPHFGYDEEAEELEDETAATEHGAVTWAEEADEAVLEDEEDAEA